VSEGQWYLFRVELVFLVVLEISLSLFSHFDFNCLDNLMDFGSLHNRYEILHIFHNVRLIMELYNVLEDQPPVATCRLDFGGLCMLIRYVAHVAQLQLAEERQLTNLVHGSPLVQWQGFFLKFSADSHIPN
jgi:hypothetical protein